MPGWLLIVRSSPDMSRAPTFSCPGDEVFGYPLVEVGSGACSYRSWIHPDDVKQLEETLQSARGNQPAACTYRIRHADGSYHRWHEEIRVSSAVDKSPVWVGCAIPVSGRSPTERALELARARLEGFLCSTKAVTSALDGNSSPDDMRLEFALRNANDGLWDWNLLTDEVYYSPRWKELLGYADHELVNHLSTWEQLVDPVDRERALQSVADYLSGASQRLEVEFRMRHKQGHWLDVLSRGVLIRDASGKPSRLVGANVDISARRRAERQLLEFNFQLQEMVNDAVSDFQGAVEALRESEARLRLALQASGAGLWSWEVATNTAWWNDKYREHYGFGLEDNWSYEKWLEAVVPEDRERLLNRITELLKPTDDCVWDEEFRILHPTNGIRWMSGLGQVERDDSKHAIKIHGVNFDITRRKAVEDELRQLNETLEQKVAMRTESLRASEHRFRSLAQATFEGVVVSQHGVVSDCNDTFAEILGGTREDLIGQSLKIFVPPEALGEVMSKISLGITVNTQRELIRLDGYRRLVEVHGHSPDGPDGMRLTAVRDITERNQAEAELAAQRAEMSRFQRLAEMSEVSAGVIHQIGQPLTAALNNVSAARIMISHQADSHQAPLEALVDADASLKQVQMTIERLRRLTHPERARRSKQDINRVIQDVIELFQPEAKAARVKLRTQLSDGLPCVAVDEVQISQALVNILRNASDAVQDCPEIRREVVISSSMEGTAAVRVDVTDCGHGISEVARDRLFQPFFTTKPEGMGVGLSLSQTITHVHGGKLSALNNDKGVGATFRITLPLDGGLTK